MKSFALVFRSFLVFCILAVALVVPVRGQVSQQQKEEFKLFFEKSYLHTDRETYTQGEDIWFKAYLLNAQTNQVFESSNNLTVELISPDTRILANETIRIEKGLGNGDFKLGDSIAGGTYRIRAYTNWMRNFGDNFIFEKTIQVYGTASPGTQPAAGPGFAAGTRRTTGTVSSPAILPKPSSPSLRFFPEGGSMIEGVNGVIAFKAENRYGKGIAAKGMITTTTGETVMPFETGSTGFGSILFLPAAGGSYEAKGNFADGSLFDVKLPPALLKGFSLFVRQTDSLVKVVVSSNAATFEEQQGGQLLLVSRSEGRTGYAARLLFADPQISVNIPVEKLSPGINSLTLYDVAGKPQCERLLYIEGKSRVKLVIQPDKSRYSSRERTTVTLKVTDQDQLPVKAALSLAVVDDGVAPGSQGNIVSYVQLQSEIKGAIEHPEAYFDEKIANRKQNLDLLLLTQGWRDFIWKRLADSAIRISYPLEQGITVSGKVTTAFFNKPLPNTNITLTAWNAKNGKLFSTTTDSAGKFFVDGLNFDGQQFVNLTAANNKGKKVGYIRADTVTRSSVPPGKLIFATADSIVKAGSGFAEELNRRMTVAKRLSLSDTLKLTTVNINANKPPGRILGDTTLTISKADYPDKYLREYMIDKIPGAVRSPRNPQWIGFYGINKGMVYGMRFPFFSTNPPSAKRITTDGFIKERMEHRDFFNLPMDKINSVRLVHNRNHDGIYDFFDGVLGDYFDIFLDVKPHAFDLQGYQTLNLDVDGYYEARTFFTPVHEVASEKPDLRTTIHWEPVISTNEKGEATVSWYNADPKTKIRIVAEGISATGIPLTATAGYVVN